MGRSRVIKPETIRVEISDGDYIVVRKELNNGQQKKLENCGLMPPMIVDGRVVQPVDWERHDLERALVFLTGWSLADDNGELMPIDISSLRAIDPSTFEEINHAVVTHIMEIAAAKKAARDAKKAAQSEPTTNAPSPTGTEDAAAPTSQS